MRLRALFLAAAAIIPIVASGPAAGARTFARLDRHVVAYRVKATLRLPGYTDLRAVALGAGGQVAGDAAREDGRRCVLSSGSKLVDITPAGWPTCNVAAMSPSGTIVGTVRSPEGSQGFVYRANRAYVIGSAASFEAVNERALVIGTKQDGSSGVYDAAAGAWLHVVDRATNCEMELPLALNDRSILGIDTCTGAPRFELASGGRFVQLHVPANLFPGKILTDSDELVLYDPSANGRAYWWAPLSGKAPVDLGEIAIDAFGGYVPFAANANGVVIGQNPNQFLSWVWTARDGMRGLETLVEPKTYFDLSASAVNDDGRILTQAFDFASGDQVWLILEPEFA